MSASSLHSFDEYLNRHDEETWTTCLTELLPAIHEVDRDATRIWFAFYPLALSRALRRADDPARLARQLLLEGHYQLKDQIDSSHRFLYGHRYWPHVKRAVAQYVGENPAEKKLDLLDHVNEVARRAAAEAKVDSSLAAGVAAVALMTAQQVGVGALLASPGEVKLDSAHAKLSPEQVLKRRAGDESQGLFGFLRKANKQWTVVYDETDERARFRAVDAEELASASARDATRDWRAIDARCIEGPIPVQCRSAACGTCWVGVLGGSENLSDVSARESKKIKEFGYVNTCQRKPNIRLACMAQVNGPVSVVIPPWNGVFGKFVGRPAAADAAQRGDDAAPDEKTEDQVAVN